MKEYGGYLPLDLKDGNLYYEYDSSRMLKCNTGLTAIYCAIKNIVPKRVFIPHFICDTVHELINNLGIEIIRYYITRDFKPINVKPDKDDCIILVNYFGVCDEVVLNQLDKFNNIIIDNTQAFFAKPIFRTGVYNVYSCRKFIGTPDGAFLIGENIKYIDLDEDFSGDRSLFLLKQHETGINSAYQESLENYSCIKNERRKMSLLTEKLLRSVDYSHIINSRKNNFNKLHSILKRHNRYDFDDKVSSVPYSYPLLLNIDIRKKLIDRRIYVPTLWKEKITEEYINKVEYDYSKNICHLPMDQRYNTEDMEYIGIVVIECLEDN